MVIVKGPNQQLAIKLIKRMKALFANPNKLDVTFDSKEQKLPAAYEALSGHGFKFTN